MLSPEPAPPTGGAEIDVLLAQIAAVERCAREHRDLLAADRSRLGREDAMDAERRLAVSETELEAVRAVTARHLAEPLHPLASLVGLRAVVCHRSDWFRAAVRQALTDHGVRVVAELENGALASGTTIAEQPDLLVLEDRLPGMTGLEVVRRAGSLSPRTRCAVQALDGARAEELQAAGAALVRTRQVPVRAFADEVVALLSPPDAPQPR